jgi:anaerobic selenocysteine-containing dehydrogenase
MSVPTSETVPFSCNLCEAMCGLLLSVENNRVTAIRGNPEDVFSRGHICPKGPALRELHEDPDRLRTPVRRTKSGWQPLSFEEALEESATRLLRIRETHGRDAIGLYIGNPTVHSHRAGFGSQLLALALSTRNRFDPNSQDGNPRLFACMQVYGDGLAMTVPDVDRTDYLLMLGANPAVSNGSQLALGDVRGRLRGIAERGGRIVLVDPRRSESAAYCSAHHFIRPGGDAALLFSLLHVMFAQSRVDVSRIRRIARGLDELRSAAAHFPPERVGPAIGMEAALIRTLALELCNAKRACVYGRIGTSLNEFGPVASWLIEVINILSGNFDRAGGVMFPAPAADIGALARLLIGNQYDRWRSRVRGLPEFLGALPSAVMAEEMETPGPGRIRGFVCFAGNPVLSTPNGERLGRALKGQLDFMLSIDYYINETSQYADIILPPAHIFESGNYDMILLGLAVRNVVKYSPPVLCRPNGKEVRDDWEILSDLALRLLLPRPAFLRRALLRLTSDLPERAVDLLLRLGRYGRGIWPWRRGQGRALSLEALRRTPNGLDLGALLPAGRKRIRTEHGLLELAPAIFLSELPRLLHWVDQRRVRNQELVLIGRRHLRSNNSWMHNVHSLVKGPERSRLLMHKEDATERGLTEGMPVRLRSRVGEISCRLALTTDIMRGVVSLPHGFGHGPLAAVLKVAGAVPGPNVNAITDELFVEPLLGTSILNGIPVRVEK